MFNDIDIYKSENIFLDLNKMFWFSMKELNFFTMSKRWKYKKLTILKRDGWKRILYSPVYKLKKAQRIILNVILYEESKRLLVDNVTWFIPWKCIKDNAMFHTWKKYILKIDIKDFFPSITQDRIYWLLRKEYNLDHSTSSYISSLCCYNNQLPQWAPTSPILANLIARFLDYKILWLLKTYNQKDWLNLTYSRYADDLTFSFNDKINVNWLINYIVSILIEEWFYPNYKKIHLISSWKQQKVTWIVVNNKAWVWRKYYKKIKSILYNISKNWIDKEVQKWNKEKNNNINQDKFRQILKGYISFINDISPEYYEKLIWYNI